MGRYRLDYFHVIIDFHYQNRQIRNKRVNPSHNYCRQWHGIAQRCLLNYLIRHDFWYFPRLKRRRSWCNIPIRPHFPLYIRRTHKWNTHLCMHLGLCSTLFSMYCTIKEVYTNGSSVLHLHLWDGGISCKWECYTGKKSRCQHFLIYIKNIKLTSLHGPNLIFVLQFERFSAEGILF